MSYYLLTRNYYKFIKINEKSLILKCYDEFKRDIALVEFKEYIEGLLIKISPTYLISEDENNFIFNIIYDFGLKISTPDKFNAFYNEEKVYRNFDSINNSILFKFYYNLNSNKFIDIIRIFESFRNHYICGIELIEKIKELKLQLLYTHINYIGSINKSGKFNNEIINGNDKLKLSEIFNIDEISIVELFRTLNIVNCLINSIEFYVDNESMKIIYKIIDIYNNLLKYLTKLSKNNKNNEINSEYLISDEMDLIDKKFLGDINLYRYLSDINSLKDYEYIHSTINEYLIYQVIIKEINKIIKIFLYNGNLSKINNYLVNKQIVNYKIQFMKIN